MKPPIPYFGAKTQVADWIVSLLPDHEHYVEPFAGSLAVLLAKPPSPLETVNDLDQRVMCFWRVLRDRPEELARACALTPHGRAEYANALCRIDDETDELERARLVWVILHQGRGRAFGAPKGWRHSVGRADPVGGQRRMTTAIDRATNTIPASAQRLRTVALECMPALDLIAKYGAHPDVLLYLDPPYAAATGRDTNGYGIEMASDAEHRTLADALDTCRAAVVLSGYPSPLYDELYEGWHREQSSATTGNGRTGERSRVEVLWSNRPLGAQGVLDLGSAA